MPVPNFVILYVDNPAESAAFYERLFGRPPVENSPTFAMFVLEGGPRLGLWKRDTVSPTASAPGGAVELVFAEDSNAAVDARHAEWRAAGLMILQEPVDAEFGRTFTAADPDGHRLRVYHVAENPR